MATVAAASVVTSLVIGIIIGALLHHFVPKIKQSREDVYERPASTQASSSNEVERSADEHYSELQMRHAQQRSTLEEAPPYINCDFQLIFLREYS